MTTIAELEKLFMEFEGAEFERHTAEMASFANVNDEDLDAAADAAYETEWRAFNRLARAISDFTNHEIDEWTAREMIGATRDELRSLIARAA